MLRVPPIIAPRFLWGDRTILDCELYQTLFSAGAYTESDKPLREREVWPCEIMEIYNVKVRVRERVGLRIDKTMPKLG